MMFDAEYFTELLNETLAMFDQLSRNYSEELSEKVDANALALSYLSEKIDDDETREVTKARLRRFFKEGAETRRRDRDPLPVDGEREALEEDLLGYARTLREKAEELGWKLREDEKIVEKAGVAFQKSVSQTRTNISGALNRRTVSSSQIFLFSFILFVFMYVLIRFF